MDEAVILQREIQQGHDDPQPLAIHPLYCQGYCEGFTIAKKMFKKKVKPWVRGIRGIPAAYAANTLTPTTASASKTLHQANQWSSAQTATRTWRRIHYESRHPHLTRCNRHHRTYHRLLPGLDLRRIPTTTRPRTPTRTTSVFSNTHPRTGQGGAITMFLPQILLATVYSPLSFSSNGE